MKHTSESYLQWLTKEISYILRNPRIWVLLVPLLSVEAYIMLAGTGVLTTDTGCKLQDTAHTSVAEDLLYSSLIHLKMRMGKARRVALVTITENNEPLSILTNTCENRSFIADVVHELDVLGARVIAIDESYSQGSCTLSAVNDLFRAALQQVRGPVVVGQRTHKRPDDVKNGDCLVADPEFDFMPAAARSDAKNNVHIGLLRLNDNSVKIPLSWKVFPDDASSEDKPSAPDPQDGFAYVAATQADPHLVTDSKLNRFRAQGEHPYASFASSLPNWSAMDLLCNGPDHFAAQHPAWGDCEGVAHTPFKLAGKVVVLGEHIESDLKPFPGEGRFGMDLHASYIEALLDNRYVGTVSRFLDDGSIVLFVFFGLSFESINLRNPKKFPQARITLWLFSLFLALMILAICLLQYGSLYMPHLLLASGSMFVTLVLDGILAGRTVLSNRHKRVGVKHP